MTVDPALHVYPRSTSDFNALQQSLLDWKQTQSGQLDVAADTARRKAVQLVAKEAAYLQQIDNMRRRAAMLARCKASLQGIQQMSYPEQRKLPSGRSVEVETPATRRAAQLCALYTALAYPSELQEELPQRLAYLNQAQQEVHAPHNRVARQLSQLLDREMDLLARNRPGLQLQGLRTRIAQTFLQLMHDEDFNPAAKQVVRGSQPQSSHARAQTVRLARTGPPPPSSAVLGSHRTQAVSIAVGTDE